jgi:hypothetical protein
MVVLQKLKGWEDLGKMKYRDREPQKAFTLEGFWQQLAQWAVVDDQVHKFQLLAISDVTENIFTVNGSCRL